MAAELKIFYVSPQYCMSNKSRPFLYRESLFKNEQDFVDKQYVEAVYTQAWRIKAWWVHENMNVEFFLICFAITFYIC